MNTKLTLALLYGGRSDEHDISIISANAVLQGINKEKFNVLPIYITRQGRWLLTEYSKDELKTEGVPITISLQVQDPTFISLADPNEHWVCDVVFPVLHGPYGEDGRIQGLLDSADIPYVGSGVLASITCMDKPTMKALFQQAGLNTPAYHSVKKIDWDKANDSLFDDVLTQFSLPWFIKPANLGSSIGISKVKDRCDFDEAMKLAFSHDPVVIIEQAVLNPREIELAILGTEDEPEVSVAGEIVPSNEFYDYKAKYEDDDSKLILPAELSDKLLLELQTIAKKAFSHMRCDGLARVDFLINAETGEVFLNELNTMPGFTPISMYSKLWDKSGIKYPELVQKLISLAFERYKRMI